MVWLVYTYDCSLSLSKDEQPDLEDLTIIYASQLLPGRVPPAAPAPAIGVAPPLGGSPAPAGLGGSRRFGVTY
jgi:hypothetical protein